MSFQASWALCPLSRANGDISSVEKCDDDYRKYLVSNRRALPVDCFLCFVLFMLLPIYISPNIICTAWNTLVWSIHLGDICHQEAPSGIYLLITYYGSQWRTCLARWLSQPHRPAVWQCLELPVFILLSGCCVCSCCAPAFLTALVIYHPLVSSFIICQDGLLFLGKTNMNLTVCVYWHSYNA